tara:strand:+ start:110 stop:1225 length:1116 start_codon:yes stop_codon:yes gene_type:complete
MNIIWCNNCVLPNTRPNIKFDKNNYCNACANHSTKKDINWKNRFKELKIIVKNAKKISGDSNYDCLIPVSGGKDSTWQIVKCLELGLKPLAVTWKTPGRTNIGSENLKNLVNLGVDHIDWQINPKIESKFMLKTFKKAGSTAIPMHFSIFNIPLRIAVKFNIPYVIYGENSAFEYGNKDKSDLGLQLNNKWIKKYGVTQGTSVLDWSDQNLTKKELLSYDCPSDKELNKAGVKAIFLGHYLQWDPVLTKKIAVKNGFKFLNENKKTGFYSFADIDDDFISIHHWLKWYKFGFTRLFDNLSVEIRNNRLTRKQAIEIIKRDSNQPPKEDIKKFCKFVKISYKEFFKIAETHRNNTIWKKNKNNRWSLNNFLF